ncbi:MAG: DUF4129 domain-containing protein [Marmoricola sp.]
MRILPGGGPLLPDPATAHDWLQRELLRQEYRPSLLQRVRDWFAHLFDKAQSGTGNFAGLGRPLLLLLVLLLVAGLVLLAVRLRRNPRAADPGETVFGDIRRRAAEHRALADAAFGDGRWDDAVVEGMRALAAALVERQLVDDLPAVTAHEVTGLAAPRFPSYAARLESAAGVFDETRYGDRHATRDRARAMLDLDRDLGAATPETGTTRRGPVEAVPR